MSRLIGSVKNFIVPGGKAPRRIPWGLASGCTLMIDLRHQATLFLGLYEVEIARHVRRLVRPGDDVFDVGGGGGYYAVALAKRTGSRVVSFECEPSAVRELRRVRRLNGNAFEVDERAVSKVDGPGAVSLDSAVAAWFVPDVIKMDIEGAELEALIGGGKLLRERMPHLILETHGVEVERDCRAILEEVGYRPVVVNRRGWLREFRPLAHNRWLICEGRRKPEGMGSLAS